MSYANEYEIGAGLDNKAFKDVNEVTDNVQRLVSPLEGSQNVHIHPDVNLAVLKELLIRQQHLSINLIMFYNLASVIKT